MSETKTLASLALGFRARYVDYETVTRQLRAWSEAFPALTRLRSIGKTPEGRELWVLKIGERPDTPRPTVWVDANMHASEFCGTSVALAIAEDVLALHLGEEGSGAHELSTQVASMVRAAHFEIMPRVSPDGAEAVLQTARWVRSTPRDDRPEREHPRWIAEDVDGDGLALSMRIEDATGDFVESRELPGVMLPRRIDDEGPFYKVFPEGRIEHFDGVTIPIPGLTTDNYPDLNRNFPHHWASEPHQAGAGLYPGSEPESRALLDHATQSPHIFAWLNLHTFGGVFIRPPGDRPDSKMDVFDFAIYTQLGQWAEALTTYPMVSGYAEFLYEPDRPLYGALSEYAYEERGALAFVCELWDLFAQIGMERPKRFADLYSLVSTDELAKMARWDREHNEGRMFRPWTRATHPQLGEVEVGGIDRRVGLFNPPLSEIAKICERMSAFMMRVAALLPQLVIATTEVRPLREDAHELTVIIENRGYLPTYGMRASRERPWNEAPWATLTCERCVLEAPGEMRREVGHLEGWGRGVGSFERAPLFAPSRGSQTRRTLRWVVRGRGEVTVRVGSCRTGFVEQQVVVG